MGNGKRLCCTTLAAISTIEMCYAADISPLSFAAGAWVKPSHEFSFVLNEEQASTTSRLAFFIGTRDITPLIRQTAANAYSYNAELLPLPSGEQRFIAYRINGDDDWQVLGEFSINVLTTTGFESAEITPRLDITESSQFSDRARGDAQASDPEQFHNMSLSAGVSTRHQRGDWETRSNWNIVGTSVKEQALRFGELQKEAPKTDLSDYLIEVQKGNNLLAVGHVNFGNNPLLVSGLGNRGVLASLQPFGRIDVSLTSQSGQSITGYNNIFGTKNFSTNSIQAGSVGYEFLPDSSASLRAEVSYLTAEVTSDVGFNIGEVADSEKSHGYGVVLSGQSSSGRVRANLSYAESTYENPFDPFLAFDDTLVESVESTDTARSAILEFDVVQPNFETGSNSSLTASFRHELTDPLYKSVAAFVNPDTVSNTVGLNGQLGQIAWQLEGNQSHDNLDDLDTVLTTVTKSASLNLNFPLQTLFQTSSYWVPNNISYSAQRVRQFGDNRPVDFDPFSHIPDQVSLLQNIDIRWQLSVVNFGYSFNWSDQDNRQFDRQDADFRDTNHGASIGFPITSRANVALSFGTVRANDKEQAIARINDNVNASLDWRITDNLSLNTNYSLNQGGDTEDFTESESQSSQTQLSYQFELPLYGGMFGGKKMPGQIFLRHSLNDNRSIDNQFQFESDGRNWSTHGGFNISFF